MAKVKSFGYVDTPIEGVSSLTFSRGLLNIKKDFAVKSVTAGKEVVLTNITPPRNQPEKIRIGYTELANAYSGTGVDPTIYTPSKRGVQILAQLSQVLATTDDTDPSYLTLDPVSFQLVVKLPAAGGVTAADIEAGLGRLLSSLFDTGSSTTSRLEAILRGALVPSEI